jgi:hypothetical protein
MMVQGIIAAGSPVRGRARGCRGRRIRPVYKGKSERTRVDATDSGLHNRPIFPHSDSLPTPTVFLVSANAGYHPARCRRGCSEAWRLRWALGRHPGGGWGGLGGCGSDARGHGTGSSSGWLSLVVAWSACCNQPINGRRRPRRLGLFTAGYRGGRQRLSSLVVAVIAGAVVRPHGNRGPRSPLALTARAVPLCSSRAPVLAPLTQDDLLRAGSAWQGARGRTRKIARAPRPPSNRRRRRSAGHIYYFVLGRIRPAGRPAVVSTRSRPDRLSSTDSRCTAVRVAESAHSNYAQTNNLSVSPSDVETRLPGRSWPSVMGADALRTAGAAAPHRSK